MNQKSFAEYLICLVRMRAAIVKSFGGAENITIEECPVPQVTVGQILIKVNCVGVNPIDTYIRSGTYESLPHLPYTPGIEGSGTVQQVGANVVNIKEGDRVWFLNPITGSCAEWCLSSADLTFKLPDGVSFEQGATLGVAFITAYRALFVKAGAQAGQTVFIHGISGGVGLAACQIAKTHGLRVVGSAGSENGSELAKRFGAQEIFNHREPNYIQKIKSKYPEGFDLILEVLANVNLTSDLHLIGKFGRIIVIGNQGNIEINPRTLMDKESAIVGVLSQIGGNDDNQRIAERIYGLLAGGHISPYVGKCLSLDQISEAHRIIMDQSVPKTGKIVLVIGGDGGGQPDAFPTQPRAAPVSSGDGKVSEDTVPLPNADQPGSVPADHGIEQPSGNEGGEGNSDPTDELGDIVTLDTQ